MLKVRDKLSIEDVERLKNHLISRGRSINTVRAYCSDLRIFFGEVGVVTADEFDDIGGAWLNMFRYKNAPSTTARRLAALRVVGKWAGIPAPMDDYSAPHPGRSVPHPIPERMDGVWRMINAAPPSDHARRSLVACGGLIGCRVSETLSLQASDFNLRSCTLTIRGKGDKTRVVPVSQSAIEVLMPSIVETIYLESPKLIPYQDRYARSIITNLGEKAQLSRRVSSHDLRATFATHVYDKTRDLRVVQELLGHESSKTTEIYTGIGMDKMREAVNL